MGKNLIKTLVCEDQVENADYLEDILRGIEEVEVVGRAGSGMEAINIVKRLVPDLVFMDIGLPGMNGLEAIEVIKSVHPDVFVVITTAHTGYALKAYNLYVYDYIVKPYDRSRVIKTVANIMKLKGNIAAGVNMPHKKARERIVIKTRDEIIFLDQQEIVMVERQERKSCIYTVNGVIETYDSLNNLEERLDREMFVRSHRGYLINVFYVDRIVNYGRKVYTVKFKNIKREALISYSKLGDVESLVRQNSYS